jgi:hypothetical protein
MPDTTVYTEWSPIPEDVKLADFWEAGADFEGEKAKEDTLRLRMKDPETKFNDVKGARARRIAEDLDKDKPGKVFWHRKK